MKDKSKELRELLIQVGLKIAKRNEGALFVVGKVDYETLVSQTVRPFNVMKNPKLLESLAIMDGAVILDKKGKMISYGALIKTTRVYKNFGTRHSAAISASKNPENLAVLVSEEDKKVRIFKEEKLIMQIDPEQKGVEKSVSEAVNLLESVGAGALGTIGTSLLVPGLGLALLPGIVVFGSAYYLGKNLHKRFSGRKK